MNPSRPTAPYVWRGAVVGALLLGPVSVAITNHYSAGVSGGIVPQFTLDLGVVSTIGRYWPLIWLAGMAGGAVCGAVVLWVGVASAGERGARVALLSLGLLGGAGLGAAIGGLSQEVAATVTAGSPALTTEHHRLAANGRHPPGVVSRPWTATGTAASDVAEGERQPPPTLGHVGLQHPGWSVVGTLHCPWPCPATRA